MKDAEDVRSSACIQVCEVIKSLSGFEINLEQGAEAMFFLLCKVRRMAIAALEGDLITFESTAIKLQGESKNDVIQPLVTDEIRPSKED